MKTPVGLIRWLPRIICILAILFVMLFSFDAFEGDVSFWNKIQGFLMHNIPTFVLVILLVIAWKHELLGGIIITVAGVLLTPFIFNLNYSHNQSVWMSLGIVLAITFPFILAGMLFIVSHYVRKKRSKGNLSGQSS